MRSTRYSLTARGRSTPPSSSRLPTGSSSFENASGWMRLPLPAAGMMPHMAQASSRATAAPARPPERVELRARCAAVCSSSVRSRARRGRSRASSARRHSSASSASLGGRARPGSRGPARRTRPAPPTSRSGSARRTPPPRTAGPTGSSPSRAIARARDVQRQARRAVEGRVLRRRHVPDEEDVRRPGEVLRILRAADHEPLVRAAAAPARRTAAPAPPAGPRHTCRDTRGRPR